jgi:four helix bundle protein
MPLRSYRELKVRQRSMDLAEAVYKATRKWPAVERFGLISQAQRAAGSIPSNIAEGYGRLHRGDYVKHLSYARGSLMELETHLILAVRVEVADPAPLRPVWTLAQRIGQMLNRLIDSLSTLDPDQPHVSPRRATRQTRKPAARA